MVSVSFATSFATDAMAERIFDAASPRLNVEDVRFALAVRVARRPDEERPLLEKTRPRRIPMLAIVDKSTCDDGARFEASYKRLGLHGTGSSCQVERAVRLADGKHVALKKMWGKDQETLERAQAEFDILRRLDHANIVKALDLHVDPFGRPTLVMENVNGSQLRALVRRQPDHFTEGSSRRYAVHLFSAVSYLHQKGVMHRDINPRNVLVSLESQTLTLIDFNIACDSAIGDIGPAGNLRYSAPEVINGLAATPASDVWAAGLCVFYMLSTRLPQGRDCKVMALEDLAKTPETFDGKVWDSVSAQCKEFLVSCLAMDVSVRTSASLALEGPWLGGLER